VNDILDHITKRGVNSNEILLIEKDSSNSIMSNVKKDYVNGFITEETTNKSISNIQTVESITGFLLSDYENPPSTPPEY